MKAKMSELSKLVAMFIFFVTLVAQAEEGFIAVNPAFKPSDIFFESVPGACPGIAPSKNNKAGEGVIAHNIEIRGWYVESAHGPDGRNGSTMIGANHICQGCVEDYHYAIIPDMEWIMDRDRNPSLSRLVGAYMRGIDHEKCYLGLCPAADPFFDPKLKCALCFRAKAADHVFPLEDPVPNNIDPNKCIIGGTPPPPFTCFEYPSCCRSKGITPNSFILPANISGVKNFTPSSDPHNLVLEPELNAYHSDVRSELPPAVLARAVPDPRPDDGGHNVYWPYDPVDPGNIGHPLRHGEYVRFVGTLYQDGHGIDTDNDGKEDEFNTGTLIGQGTTHMEIHPPDLIERNPQRELNDMEVTALVNGTMLTTEKNPSPRIPRKRYMGLRVYASPGGQIRSDSVKIVPTTPRPSPECKLKVEEWVDGRFTDLKTVGAHPISVVDNDDDPHVDVMAQVIPTGGRPGLFKAIYQVWWDCTVPGHFTAVWRIGAEPEIAVYGWKYSDYRAKYDELWGQGWRLYSLQPYVIDNQVLYNAVWRKSTEGEIQVYGWSYQDYRNKYDELWGQGWRLKLIQPYVVNNQVFYTAVWRPSTENEIQVYGWSYQDYRNKYDELWGQGWRLKLIQPYVVNNQVFYTAVWWPSTENEVQVYGWSYPDFRSKYDELWGQGWRLKLIQPYVLNNQVLYTAVWRPSTENEVQVYGWSYQDFRKKYDELSGQGWRLFILQSVM